MATLPKSSAEILAASKQALKIQIQPRKLKTDLKQAFNSQLSTFSSKLEPSVHETASESRSFLRSEESAVHSISSIRFNDTVTPNTLKAALEIKEGRLVDVEGTEDLFDYDDDEPQLHTWASGSEPDSPVDSISSASSQMPLTLSQRIQDALDLLRGRRLSPFDLVLEILDENKPQYSYHRAEFYKEGNHKLENILDVVLANSLGKKKLRTWVQQPAAVDLFCDVVSEEMDSVRKAALLPGIATAATPEFIQNWTVSAHQELAPCLLQILSSAAQTTTAKEKNKKKNPEVLLKIIMKQLNYQRSTNSLGFQTVFGLFLWASGCSRQAIDSLHKCGLSISYCSVLNAISSLATRCIELAVDIGSGIHAFCYDNVNLSTSIFVEQRGASSPAKVTSGTFAVLYKVRNGNREHMKLCPIMERFKRVKALNFYSDLQPTDSQIESVYFQFKMVVLRVLTKYVKGFEPYSKDQDLQHRPRRIISKGYTTEQFPLRATTIEEATVRGNLLFHDDIYSTQLKRSVDTLSEYAIPSINDQLTNSRIRSGQILRARDVSPWERREVFQLGFGLFHLCLNLVWALLHVHRGSLGDTGSLTYYFALLEKVRLGGDHPDYHSLLASLTQIFDGLVLNAWRTKCGHKTLADFAASQPTSKDLEEIAGKIIEEYASPLDTVIEGQDEDSDDEASALEVTARKRRKPLVPPIVKVSSAADPGNDKVHQNSRLLTRDLLYLLELIRAISDGDIGRIEDLFPQLAMMFRGAGSNNYCAEILHFILNLKYVWTPEFANIMRDNMIVNVSGLEGHAMGMDLNMEHLIGQLKDLLTAKGLQSTWDRLGDTSAAIDYLNKIKKKVSHSLSSTYQSSTHTTPDTSHLVWRVADKVRDEEIQVFKENRAGNSKVKSVVDVLATGEAKLKSSSLATFNRKIRAMVNGRLYEDDEDTIPPPHFSLEEMSGEGDTN